MMIADFVLCLVLASFAGGGPMEALLGVLALWVATNLLLLYRNIVGLILFAFWGKRTMVASIVDDFIEWEFPRPSQWELSPADYLAAIGDDEKQPMKVRILAAVQAGALSAYRAMNAWVFYWKLTSAMESALEEMRKRLPKPAEAKEAA